MSIEIERGGMLTTVQDLGRDGLRRHGIVRGGAMDRFALRCANLLAGNAENAAALECTITGPRLRFHDERIFCVAGHDPEVTLDGRPVTPWAARVASAGSTLDVRTAGRGCRIYVAIAGGIDVPCVLGSRSTDLAARFGGHDGRALRDGDALPLGAQNDAPHEGEGLRAGRSMLPRYAAEAVLRVVAGPELNLLDAAALETLVSARFTVTSESSRMGYRLAGPPLRTTAETSLVSSPVTPGTVQLPPSGEPILLLADAQTIGGYPRIAHVIDVDLPIAAQVRPGGTIRLQLIDVAAAASLMAQRERDLRVLRAGIRLRSP